MVTTAYNFKNSAWLSSALISRSTLVGAVLATLGSIAVAQSPTSFATVPYPPNTVAIPPVVAPAVSLSPTSLAAVSPRYRGPMPVVMFRGAPPIAQPAMQNDEPIIEFVEPPPLAQTRATPRPYSITNTAQRDAANAGWNPASLEAVAAPPLVSSNRTMLEGVPERLNSSSAARAYRGPMRRIWQDTRRSITRDLPEAVADALPWVDRDAKNEPFDDVLDRVADDLNRAAQGDPAWALPAQREIRALSQRLDLLPSPPPLARQDDASRPTNIATGADDRPFRPRPIWPGASGRPEAQVRPVTLVTASGQQDGPRVAGVSTRYIAAAEDDDGMPVTRATAPSRAPARRSSSARPAPKSR